jgi:hypothetical protein
LLYISPLVQQPSCTSTFFFITTPTRPT